MISERVRAALEAEGMGKAIIQFDTSIATVAQAAAAVGCTPGRIAKTLAFEHEGRALLLVVAGDRRIDNRKFRAAFGHKAKMLSPEETLERVGHPVGGVCPFAVHEGTRICLDVSLRDYETVFPSAGSLDTALELTPERLERLSAADAWVDVCQDME